MRRCFTSVCYGDHTISLLVPIVFEGDSMEAKKSLIKLKDVSKTHFKL